MEEIKKSKVGSVLGWGSNKNGELLLGKDVRSDTPRLVQAFESQGITNVACGDRFSLCLDEFGNIYSFGSCTQGQLGHGQAIENCSTPIQVGGELLARKVVDFAAGYLSSAAITADGELFEWGLLHYTPEDNSHASIELHGLGRAGPRKYVSPMLSKLIKESTLRYMTSSEEERVATKANTPGAEGAEAGTTQEDETNRADAGVINLRIRRRVVCSPILNQSLLGKYPVKVALGAAHVTVICSDGRVYSKGYNDRGQLGCGDRISRAEFTPASGPINNSRCVDIACGGSHCLALTDNGQVWVFGTNAFGQLGLGPKYGEQLIPKLNELLLDEEIVQVQAGDHHSVCLSKDGEVLSFGHAEYGQHGGNANAGHDLTYAHLLRYFYSPRPIRPFCFKERDESPVNNPDSFVRIQSIASHARYNLGIDSDGHLWSWGWNGCGVLGHGAGARWTNPHIVEELVGTKVISVAAGPSHVMVVTEQSGSQFALSYASLLPKSQNLLDVPRDGKACVYDVIIRSKLSATQAKEKEASFKYSAEAHAFVVFSRCPTLTNFVTEPQDLQNESDGGKTVVSLPFVLAPLVLQSFVEYLYCDHIRSCPPHRIVDLEHLGQSLKMDHLVSVCAISRFQRSLKMSILDAQARADKKPPKLVESSFKSDMDRAVTKLDSHDVFFQAADRDEEENEGTGTETDSPGMNSNSTDNSIQSGDMEKEFIVNSAHLDLVCRYPFFEKLLTGSFKEAQNARDKTNPVLLHNLTPKGLSRLIHWMYCGDRDASLDPDTVMSVLATARCFGVEDLARVCEQYILERIDEENVSFIQDFAQMINSPRLLHRCSQVTNASSSTVVDQCSQQEQV